MPRPDILDFDGFVLRRGAANRGGLRGALGVVKKSMVFLWVKQCHKPPGFFFSGNGKFLAPIRMVMTGGWFMASFYTH